MLTQKPRLGKSTIQLLGGSLIGRSLGFLANLFITRSIGPSGLGIFSLVLTTAQTFEITARGGIDYGLQCEITEKGAQPKGEIARAASDWIKLTTFLLAILLAIWIFLLEGVLPNSSNTINRELTAVLLISICCLESLGGLPWDIFLIAGKTKLVALRQGLFAPIKLFGAALGANLDGVNGALCGYALVSLAQTTWLRDQCHKLTHTSQRPNWGFWKATGLVKRGLPLYLTNALNALVFLPLLVGVAAESGLNNIGYIRIGQLIVQIFTMLPGALIPILFLRLRLTDRESERRKTSEQSLRLLWSMGILVLLGYISVDKQLVTSFFGADYLPSLQATRILALAAILESTGQLLHTPLLANQQTTLFFVAQNSASLIAGVVGLLLIPSLGIQGFLLSKLVYSWIPVGIYIIHGWKQFLKKGRIGILMAITIAVTMLCWSNIYMPVISMTLLIIIISGMVKEVSEIQRTEAAQK